MVLTIFYYFNYFNYFFFLKLFWKTKLYASISWVDRLQQKLDFSR